MTESKEANCPFYKRNGNGHIVCIGWQQDLSITLSFRDKEDFRLYIKGYCESDLTRRGWEECELFKTNIRIAEEEGEIYE